MNHRIEKLKNSLTKKGIQSLLLSGPANVSYICGFPTQDSYLLINQDKSLLITDSRYSTEYKNILKEKNSLIEVFETNKPLPITLKGLRKQIKNLAFEENYVSFSLYQKLKSFFGNNLSPKKEIVEDMRLVKDNEELIFIRKAVSITLDTFKFIEKIIKPKMTELALAAEIERYIRLKGASQAAYEIIVASGPHSSFPHAKKTNREIRENEPVLIDLGVEYNGYKSDLTRVFFLGKMSVLFKRVSDTVRLTQEIAKKAIKPGVPIADIDKKARDFIDKRGFKNCFKHSLGHGVGLEVHELPRIAPKNKKLLKSGMVFTLEPAIYLDNKFGVRIEDMVLVTSTGAEVLSGS